MIGTTRMLLRLCARTVLASIGLVAAVLLSVEVASLGDTAHRFGVRAELTQLWLTPTARPETPFVEDYLHNEVLLGCKGTPVILSAYVVEPVRNAPERAGIIPRHVFWAVSDQGSGPVRLWPIGESYSQAVTDHAFISGRLPEKAGEAVLTEAEAELLFGGKAKAAIGSEFEVVMRCSQELLNLFPEGTFASLASEPATYSFILVGIRDDAFLESPNAVAFDEGPVVVDAGRLREAAVLGSIAIWPDGMRESMARLPVAAAAWMHADEMRWPEFGPRLAGRFSAGHVRGGLINMGEYTSGQAELAHDSWYVCFSSISDLSRSWLGLARLSRVRRVSISGIGTYTAVIAPVIDFLQQGHVYAETLLLPVLALLGLAAGILLVSRHTRTLAVLFAYAGPRSQVFRRCLAAYSLAVFLPLAVSVLVVPWLISWQYAALKARLAFLEAAGFPALLPTYGDLTWLSVRYAALIAIATVTGVVFSLYRLSRREVGEVFGRLE